jgi:hypothetical protein
MAGPKVYEFSKHIGALCATRGTDVYKLGAWCRVGSERICMSNRSRRIRGCKDSS